MLGLPAPNTWSQDPMRRAVYPNIYLPIYLSVCLCLPVCLSIYLYIYLCTYLSIYQPIHITFHLTICRCINCISPHIYIYIYIYTCSSHVHMYIHTRVYIYICIYIVISPCAVIVTTNRSTKKNTREMFKFCTSHDHTPGRLELNLYMI